MMEIGERWSTAKRTGTFLICLNGRPLANASEEQSNAREMESKALTISYCTPKGCDIKIAC